MSRWLGHELWSTRQMRSWRWSTTTSWGKRFIRCERTWRRSWGSCERKRSLSFRSGLESSSSVFYVFRAYQNKSDDVLRVKDSELEFRDFFPCYSTSSWEVWVICQEYNLSTLIHRTYSVSNLFSVQPIQCPTYSVFNHSRIQPIHYPTCPVSRTVKTVLKNGSVNAKSTF